MHRDRFGVEPICRDPGRVGVRVLPARDRRAVRPAVEDERLTGRIREVHEANYECYGYRRVHAQLVREGETAGRDQVARLMGSAGIQGAKRRGKPWRTTTADPEAQRASDLVKRDFTATAPDRLWVGDFTYLRSWEGRQLLLVHHRRVLTDDRRLADRPPHAHQPGARRAADGARSPPARRGLPAGVPYRPGLAIHRGGLHPAARRRPRAGVGRVGRRLLRQRARRDRSSTPTRPS